VTHFQNSLLVDSEGNLPQVSSQFQPH